MKCGSLTETIEIWLELELELERLSVQRLDIQQVRAHDGQAKSTAGV